MYDGTQIVNPMGLADQSAAMNSFSQELDNIANEAHQLLAGSSEFFDSKGAASYAQAQQMINEGIQDGKDVIYRHGNAIDTVGSNSVSNDLNVGNSFDV